MKDSDEREATSCTQTEEEKKQQLTQLSLSLTQTGFAKDNH